MFLGHVGRVAHAINAAGAGENEPPHAGLFANPHQRQERFVVHRMAQRRVELDAGIVGDASQMDDLITALHRHADGLLVAHVAVELPQPRMILDRGQRLLAVDIEVQHVDFVAQFQQSRHEHGADIAGPAGDENAVFGCFNHGVVIHS